MNLEHRARGKGEWFETHEERAREMIRRTYGPDREAWAMGQLERGRILQVEAGELRAAEA